MESFFKKAIADVKSLSGKDFIAMANRMGFKAEVKTGTHFRPEIKKSK